MRNWALRAGVNAALVIAMPGTAAAATIDFEPYVGAAIGYVDNIELNPDGQTQTSDGVIELEAGFNSRYTSQRLLGGLNYRYRYLDYFDADEFDSDFHNLGASARLIAVQELLYFDAGAFYQQQLKDPAGSPGFGNFFNSGDLRDAWGWNVTPVLTQDFGYATAYASYRYGRVYYTEDSSDTEDSVDGLSDDSTNRDLQVSLATSNPNQPLTWRVFYLSSRTDYVDFDPYRYDQAGVDLGWAIGQDFRLVGEYGVESDLTQNVEEGGLDSAYWNAGVVYEPNDRNRLEARAGERFFGDSYEFYLRHVARLAEFNVSYTEQPTTNSNRLGAPNEGPPDEVPPFPDVPGFQDTRTEAYLLKRWYVALKIDGSRTVVDFSWYNDDQTYFDTGRESNSRAGQIGVTRELGPRSDVRLWWARRDWQDKAFEVRPGEVVPSRDTEDHVLTLRFSRDLGRDLTLSAETALQRRREQDEDWANGWWLGLRVRKTF